jgi:hypothetical protein
MRYLQARKALEAPFKSVAFYNKCMNIRDLFSKPAHSGDYPAKTKRQVPLSFCDRMQQRSVT